MDIAKVLSLAAQSRALADLNAEERERLSTLIDNARKLDTRLGKFFDSLTPEQKAVWEKLNRFGNDSRQDELVEFFTSLTDEQSALLNNVFA